MVTVKLMGGLGNQMFQYAAARAIAVKHNTFVTINNAYLNHRIAAKGYTFRTYDLDVFTMSPSRTLLSKVPQCLHNAAYIIHGVILNGRKRLTPGKVIRQIGGVYEYHGETEFAGASCYLNGFFQNLRYFEAASREIRKEFGQYRFPLTVESQRVLAKIEATESVALSFRRTDYIKSVGLSNEFINLSESYYSEALQTIASRLSNPFLFIFSDDISWCKANLKFPYPTIFVGPECTGYKASDNLRLMASCKHIIISNSTFAWWGAWLKSTPGLVVAPRKWMHGEKGDASGLLPESWAKI